MITSETDVLMKYRMTEAKAVSTPTDLSVRLQKCNSYSKQVHTYVDRLLYQSIVGSLLYAAIATRPDIAQSVGVVSKFTSRPTEFTAAKRILCYLKGMISLSIKYQKSCNSYSKQVHTYVDRLLYQSIVGSLLYAAIATRPDIAQSVGVVSKFTSRPTEFTAAKRILCYLKGMISLSIKYQKS